MHVSMVGFDDGTEKTRILDGHAVSEINANLTSNVDVTIAQRLSANSNLSFRGTQKSGDFDIPKELALQWLNAPNPHGRPNSDVLRPWLNGTAIVQRPLSRWIIDTSRDDFALYELPFALTDLGHVSLSIPTRVASTSSVIR